MQAKCLSPFFRPSMQFLSGYTIEIVTDARPMNITFSAAEPV